MNLPPLPHKDIGETDCQAGYSDKLMKEYGELYRRQHAFDEAVALIDTLSGCSVEYIKDRLMDLKG